MLMSHRKTAALLAATAVAVLLPFATMAQAPQGAPAGAPGAAAPGGGGGRAGRGGDPGVPAGDYNVSLRSAADKALPNNRYARDESWMKMPAGRTLGSTSAIDIDRDGKSIWVAERCGGPNLCIGKHVPPIIKFSPDGHIEKTFGADMVTYPHGIWVDRDDNIWVADLQSNVEFPPRRGGGPAQVAPAGTVPNGAQVLKFSPNGKLLMTLGTPGHYGTDEAHFSQPSDVITDTAGNIYVADGHDSLPSNSRIVKFDKTGKFIKAWNSCGTNPTDPIDCGHSLAMDSQGRLFVANRGNARIEIYDQDGNLQAEWKQFGKPSGLFIDKNDILYAADSESSVGQGNAYVRGVHVGSAKTGEVTDFLPDVGGNPSPWFPLVGTTGPEGVVSDGEGHIFISQVQPYGEVVKYTVKTLIK